MSFEDKAVLVTGAGSGLGAALALHFAGLGARVSLVDVDRERLEAVGERCRALAGADAVHTEHADLTRDDDVARALDGTLQRHGRLDVLVNCAGVHGAGGVRDADLLARYDRVMAVNLRAVVALTARAVPALLRTQGCVVNVSSVAPRLPCANLLPYCLSKSGVILFTRSAALALANDGVRVNCISPGPVETELLVNAGLSRAVHDSFWEAMRRATPLRRAVRPADVAECAAFLASERAACITGAEFVVDAGFTLAGGANVPGMTSNE